MFASTLLNYTDRQALALVRPQIEGEFGLLHEDFGWVMAVFSMTYALFQLPAGLLVDRGDVRWTYAAAVAWWSLAGMATALAPSLGTLMVFRALLGVGESFNWPCALRVTERVLPPSDRGLGNGIFNSGAAVGAILTPLLIPLLTLRFGWRTAFLAVGASGFLWVVAWVALLGGRRGRALLVDQKPMVEDELPDRAPGLSARARAAFRAVAVAAVLVALSAVRWGLPAVWWGIALFLFGVPVVALGLSERDLEGARWAEGLGQVVRYRRFWVLASVSISINVCWHFLVSWLPTFLEKDRKLTALADLVGSGTAALGVQWDPKYLASALLTALIFVAADLGNLGGGALSMRLARRGTSPAWARIRVMLACVLLISGGAWVGLIGSDVLVVVLLCGMALGASAFMANYFAFCQDVAPRQTGLVVGILGAWGNLFVAGFHPIAGKVKDLTGGFGPVFVVVGLLPFIGLGTLLAGWGESGSIPKSS